MKNTVPRYKEWNLSHLNTVLWIKFKFFSWFVLRKEKQTDFLKERTLPNIWLPFIHAFLKSLFKATKITREALKVLFGANLFNNATEECRLNSKSKQIPWDWSSWKDRGTVFCNIKGNGIHLLYFPLFCSEIWETLSMCSLGISKNKLFLAPHTHCSSWKSYYTLPVISQKKIKAFEFGNIQNSVLSSEHTGSCIASAALWEYEFISCHCWADDITLIFHKELFHIALLAEQNTHMWGL